MDLRFREVERRFFAEPNKDTLVQYLREIERAGLSEDYPRIVAALRSVPPFTDDVWPWHPDAITFSEALYRESLHRDILNLIARIRPLGLVAEIISAWTDPRQLIEIMLVVRRYLLDEFIDDIVPQEDMDALWDYPEDVRALASNRGLTDYPEYLVLEPSESWEHTGPLSWAKYGYFPKNADAIVTVVIEDNESGIVDIEMEGDIPHPVIGPYRIAVRYSVGLDMEPSRDIFWMSRWDERKGYWVNEHGNRGSSTFLPYRVYCYTHNQDLIKCGRCPACGAKDHDCWCENCDECGLYVNLQHPLRIAPELRCHCGCWGECIYGDDPNCPHPS